MRGFWFALDNYYDILSLIYYAVLSVIFLMSLRGFWIFVGERKSECVYSRCFLHEIHGDRSQP